MIKLICVGKLKDKSLQVLQSEYLKRLKGFGQIELIEVKDEPDIHSERENEARKIKDAEGKRVLEKVRSDDTLILLDLHGKMVDSIEFSRLRSDWSQKSGNLVFAIAGSLGPSQELISRANWRWKMSDLTFTHMMCRILVLEQIYRSFMIENNRTYHK